VKAQELQAAVFVLILLLSALAGTYVNPAKANPEPLPTLRVYIESPSNKTYSQDSILLNVTFHTQPNEYRDSKVYYTIKGENASYSGLLFQGLLKQSQPIWRNVTITEIPDGSYSLEVGAEHICDRWFFHSDESAVNFTIDTGNPEPTATPEPQQEPFPTLWVVAAVAIVATGGAASAIYYFTKKPRRIGNNSQNIQKT